MRRPRSAAGRHLESAPALLVIAAGTALALVSALVWSATIAWRHQRAADDRARDNIATIAARGLAARLEAIVANEAAEWVDRIPEDASDRDVAQRAHHVADSLAACGCGTGLRVSDVRRYDLGALRDGVDPLRHSLDVPADVRDAVLQAATRHVPVVRLVPPASVAALIPLTKAGRTTVADVRFAPEAFTRDLVPYALDSIGPIVPTVLTGHPTNRDVFAIRVDDGDRTVFQSTPAAPGDHAFSATLFGAPTLRVTAFTTPSLVVPTVGAATPRIAVSAALAAATVLAVIASTLLAIRSVQLARARAEFTAAVSHELRTPLTEIMLYADLVESGREPPGGVRHAASLIGAEARRLHQMVDNVLHVTRNAGEGFVVDSIPVRVGGVIEESVRAFGPVAAQAASTIVLQLDGDPVAMADVSAVRQIMRNLLDNAVRYGPDEQTIVVRLAAEEDGVRITVDDAGPGIPPADRDRLFAPYVRLTRDLDRARSGTGLGLSVVKALVSAMGGDVRIGGSTRGGTRVTVTLPAVIPNLQLA